MNNEVIPDEVKITHIFKGKEEKSDFIEFMRLRNGKSAVLRTESFIKRYGNELIEAFKSSQVK